MALIQSPLALLAVLAVGVVVAEGLGRLPWGRKVGTALIVIVLGALLANFRIVPPAGAGGPVYDPIFSVVTPAAIFLILLDANLKALRKAGGPMLIAVAIASNANIGGATSAVSLAEAFGREDLVLPGLIAGTIGTAIGTYVGFAVAAVI